MRVILPVSTKVRPGFTLGRGRSAIGLEGGASREAVENENRDGTSTKIGAINSEKAEKALGSGKTEY